MNIADVFDHYQETLDRCLQTSKKAIIEWLTSSYFGNISPHGTTFAVIRGAHIVLTFSVSQPTQGGYNVEIPMAITEDQIELGCDIDCETILVAAEQIEVDDQ